MRMEGTDFCRGRPARIDRYAGLRKKGAYIVINNLKLKIMNDYMMHDIQVLTFAIVIAMSTSSLAGYLISKKNWLSNVKWVALIGVLGFGFEGNYILVVGFLLTAMVSTFLTFKDK